MSKYNWVSNIERRRKSARERLIARIELLKSDAPVADYDNNSYGETNLYLSPEDKLTKLAIAEDDLRNLNRKLNRYAA